LSLTFELLHACPACGSTRLETVASGSDVERQAEALWLFHTRRLHGGTPPTHLLDRAAFSQRPPLAISGCTRCGTLLRNPREDATSLHDVYAQEEVGEAALAALLEPQRGTCRAQAARLGDALGRIGRVLEVGSYAGGFLEAAAAAGWDAHGMDVNAHAVRFACGRGLRVRLGGIADADADERYDAIVFWNVFEQIDDPARALAAARQRLSTGGIVAVRVPSGRFYRRLLRVRPPLRAAAWAVLAWNNLLAFPYRHGFTPAALDALFRRYGLRVTGVHGDALVRISDAHTRAWARAEEAALKTLLRTLPARSAPWIEVFGR
jgi:2-polyprenyl-3-methyl-5-hydroxy-6-metoxy-1,4-benzoquinol methylase